MADDQNPKIEKSSLDEKQISFEKYKYRLGFFKWLIGSVALVSVTMVIDYGFRDRAAGMHEMEQYDKYITELLVLNKEPGQKRMLAQFFAHVTPSDKLKQGWADYYKVVDEEYQKFIAPVKKNDSIVREQYDSLITNYQRGNIEQNERLITLKSQIEENKRLISPDIVLPSSTSAQRNKSSAEWEQIGFSHLLGKDVDNALIAFRNSENAYVQSHQIYETVKYLTENKSALQDSNSDLWRRVFKKIANNISPKSLSD